MEKKYPLVFFVTRKPSNFQTLLDERPVLRKKVRRPVGERDLLHGLSCCLVIRSEFSEKTMPRRFSLLWQSGKI
jgi:hypothetical protein